MVIVDMFCNGRGLMSISDMATRKDNEAVFVMDFTP